MECHNSVLELFDELFFSNAGKILLKRSSEQLHPALEPVALPGLVQLFDELGFHTHREHLEVALDTVRCSRASRADRDLPLLGLTDFPFEVGGDMGRST